ncbi:MAG: hypothetical protein ACI4HI_01465 [Lachnospiraceae bacterium]
MPQNKFLNDQKNKQVFLSAIVDSGASSHAAFQRGSMTLEATLVLPIFVLILFYFLFFFQVIKMEIQVEQALQYTSRTMAVYAGVGDVLQEGDADKEKMQQLSKGGKLISKTVAKGMVTAQLKQSGAETKFIKSGVVGLNFSQSDLSGDYIDLIVRYKLQLPFNFFKKIKTVDVQQRARTHKWTGDHGLQEAEKEDKIVYITETGSVYHTTKSCKHLDLSIRSVDVKTVEKLRNKDGGKYYACSCCKGSLKSGNVYITDYGTNYHKNRNCSGLKRTVKEIPLSKVGGRRPCKSCGGK